MSKDELEASDVELKQILNYYSKNKDELIFNQKMTLVLSVVLMITLLFHLVITILLRSLGL